MGGLGQGVRLGVKNDNVAFPRCSHALLRQGFRVSIIPALGEQPRLVPPRHMITCTAFSTATEISLVEHKSPKQLLWVANVSMAELYPSIAQAAVVAAAFKILLFPA